MAKGIPRDAGASARARLRALAGDPISQVDPLEECLNAHRESYESDVLEFVEGR